MKLLSQFFDCYPENENSVKLTISTDFSLYCLEMTSKVKVKLKSPVDYQGKIVPNSCIIVSLS